jgi:hypothetical protein
MTGVVVEELQSLDDPGVEAGLHVLRYFAHDVFAVLEPLEFGSRRRGPDGFFTFLAVVTITHRSAYHAALEKPGPSMRKGPPPKREPFPIFELEAVA